MNPERAVHRLRERARQAQWLNTHEEVTSALLRMSEEFRALDDWLTSGGDLPPEWGDPIEQRLSDRVERAAAEMLPPDQRPHYELNDGTCVSCGQEWVCSHWPGVR